MSHDSRVNPISAAMFDTLLSTMPHSGECRCLAQAKNRNQFFQCGTTHKVDPHVNTLDRFNYCPQRFIQDLNVCEDEASDTYKSLYTEERCSVYQPNTKPKQLQLQH